MIIICSSHHFAQTNPYQASSYGPMYKTGPPRKCAATRDVETDGFMLKWSHVSEIIRGDLFCYRVYHICPQQTVFLLLLGFGSLFELAVFNTVLDAAGELISHHTQTTRTASDFGQQCATYKNIQRKQET